jgi:hypothetical protein
VGDGVNILYFCWSIRERCTVTERVSALQHYFIAHGSSIAAGPLNLHKLALFDLC